MGLLGLRFFSPQMPSLNICISVSLSHQYLASLFVSLDERDGAVSWCGSQLARQSAVVILTNDLRLFRTHASLTRQKKNWT